MAATEPIEELLLSLADGADEDPPLHTTLHQPAAEAAGLLRVAIDQAPVARLFGTDGRYEHEGHAVVTVDETVMARFAAAVEELVAALRPGARADVADFLDHWAGDRHTTAENLVGLATRFVELCRLPWDADHDVLTEPLTHAQSSLERTGAHRRPGGRLPPAARPVRGHLARRRPARPLAVLGPPFRHDARRRAGPTR